jgi:hypothetical protein
MNDWIELPGTHVLAMVVNGKPLTVERFRCGDEAFVRGPDGKTQWLSRAAFLSLTATPKAAACPTPIARNRSNTKSSSPAPARASSPDPKAKPMSAISKATALVRALVTALEDEDVKKARAVCKQILAALGEDAPDDDADDDQDDATESDEDRKGTQLPKWLETGDGAKTKAALIRFATKLAHSADPELRGDALAKLDRLDPARARSIRAMRRGSSEQTTPKINVGMVGSTLVVSAISAAERVR